LLQPTSIALGRAIFRKESLVANLRLLLSAAGSVHD
jgi:hypothetical protein